MAAVLLWFGVALDAGVLVGLVVRGRWQNAWFFSPWLLATMATSATVGLCPSCNTWKFWLSTEFLHITLALLLGIELSLRLCVRQTRPRRQAWILLALVAMGIALCVATAASVVDLLPQLVGAIAALYLGLALLLGRRDVNVTALHSALLDGFTLYLIVYLVAWGFTRDDTRWAGFLSPLAFDLVMLYLLRVAWQREEYGVPLRERLARVRGWQPW